MGKRALGEFLATIAALGAVTLYLQLSDPTSATRLWLEAKREEIDEWSIRTKVDNLVNSIHHTGSNNSEEGTQ